MRFTSQLRRSVLVLLGAVSVSCWFLMLLKLLWCRCFLYYIEPTFCWFTEMADRQQIYICSY